jgi:hypothetical protein
VAVGEAPRAMFRSARLFCASSASTSIKPFSLGLNGTEKGPVTQQLRRQVQGVQSLWPLGRSPSLSVALRLSVSRRPVGHHPYPLQYRPIQNRDGVFAKSDEKEGGNWLMAGTKMEE